MWSEKSSRNNPLCPQKWLSSWTCSLDSSHRSKCRRLPYSSSRKCDALAGAEQMDTDMQEKEADQSDMQMGNGDGAQGLGNKEPMEDAVQT